MKPPSWAALAAEMMIQRIDEIMSEGISEKEALTKASQEFLEWCDALYTDPTETRRVIKANRQWLQDQLKDILRN